MRPSKRWKLAEPHPAAAELAARLKVSPLVAQCLLNRGIADVDAAGRFLKPTLKDLHDPSLIPGLKPASDRIARAIRDRERIVIYGDYDVDGITATAILWHAIKLLGGDVRYYIPHRIDEGYGLNADAIAQIIDEGAKLIITVDCGVTAVAPAQLARDRGVDLIITDHHEWHEGKEEDRGSKIEDRGWRIENGGSKQSDPHPSATLHPPSSILDLPSSTLHPPSSILHPRLPPLLPACCALVHPRLPSETPYPNPSLCGAGVAFKLAWGIGLAVNGTMRVTDEFRAFLVEATALAALGTIADVVPLVGENRVLAHFGLGGLKASTLTGIRALIASAALTGQNLDSYHVGFLLAPRLNACGRMGHAALAVEMLTDADQARATEIAVYLEEQNRARQSIERDVLDQALAQLEAGGFDADQHRAIVLGAEGWHAGVVGIVASRLVDRFCRPAVMVALTNGHGQGSGRSVAGFHLARALERCGEHLVTYGGHEMAAGLKLKTEKLPDFRAAFTDYAATAVSDQMLTPEISVEATAQLPQISEALVGELRRLGPFGHGNRKPLLAVRDATIAAPPRRVGRTGDHLQLLIKQNGHTIKAIAFGYGDAIDRLGTGTPVELAVEPGVNEYQGRRTVELEVKDLRILDDKLSG